ncbi:MAG: hypothetical protein WKF81_00570 [Thermomicrobiales bacterium]
MNLESDPLRSTVETGNAPSAFASLLYRFSATSPLLLGLIQCLTSAAIVLIMLGTPVLEGRAGMMNLTESWGALERVALWQRSLSWIPGVEQNGGIYQLPVAAIAWLIRLLLLTLFLVHAIALIAAWSGPLRSKMQWLTGPVGSLILMIGFVPSNADIFFYEISGDIANSGTNPYTHYLYEFGNNPILPYNHWVDMTTVYGPFWTGINRLIMGSTGPDPYIATVIYKVMFGLAAIGLALLTAWITQRLTGSRRLATVALVFVAWHPTIILESSGQAHNDIVVALISTVGMAAVLLGGIAGLRAAIIIVTLSSTVKYVTLPLVGILGLLRLTDRNRPDPVRRILGSWLLDGTAILAVIVATFAPYWAGPETFREMFLEPGRLFAHPIWLVPYLLMSQFAAGGVVSFYVEFVRIGLQIATFVLLLYLIVRYIRSLWTPNIPDAEEPSDSRPWWTGHLIRAWVGVLAILALVPANSHAWYWTWTVAPIAVLLCWNRSQDSSPETSIELPRWLIPYLVLIATMTLIYHTRIVMN